MIVRSHLSSSWLLVCSLRLLSVFGQSFSAISETCLAQAPIQQLSMQLHLSRQLSTIAHQRDTLCFPARAYRLMTPQGSGHNFLFRASVLGGAPATSL